MVARSRSTKLAHAKIAVAAAVVVDAVATAAAVVDAAAVVVVAADAVTKLRHDDAMCIV
jgi:hypothetical protein